MPVIDYASIKQSTMDSLRRYAQHHIPTGGFLQAVLENNLMQACGRADEENAIALFQICSYIYNELPAPSHGSPAKVAAWLKARTP
jgi:hypothetical protein